MATIKDVARLSGMSISTVSRFINGNVPLSKRAEKHINSAIKELNFIPNTYAGQLKKKHSNFIAIVVPDINNPFFSKLITTLERLIKERGYVLMLFNTSHNKEITDEVIKTILSYRAFSVIVLGRALYPENYDELIRVGVKTLAIEDHYKGIGSLELNNTNIGYEQTKYLHNRGLKHILFAGKSKNIPATLSRYEGYKSYIKKANLNTIEPLESNFLEVDEIYSLLSKKTFDGIDSIVCSSDMVAFGILRFAHKHGIKIPEDISIIGCDNNPYSEILHPPLTSVNFPFNELVEQVVSYFFGDKFVGISNHSVEIIERESVI